MATTTRALPFTPPARYRRRQVRFVLGTDEHIHRETRVGLAPCQVRSLGDDLRACGLEPELRVIAGAGDRAGFPDRDYARAGAEVIDAAAARAQPVDLVHALKEPTAWESELPGPFLRLGALHLASKPAGLCTLLRRRNFAAIIDGGMVGGCAYVLNGGDRTPIVSSMSRFAGAVAAGKLRDGVGARGHRRGKVVVVGGGIAGMSAIETLGQLVDELVLVERQTRRHEQLAERLRALGIGRFRLLETIADDTLDDAVGVIFAHRSGARAAEKVCTLDQIRRMTPGAGIADIAIDQCGSILHDGYDENDDAWTARNKYRVLLDGPFFYYAEVNMPREEPYEASRVHGEAILPYLTTLLVLIAVHGDPAAVVRALHREPARHFNDPAQLDGQSLFECLVQDLRNGLQIAVIDGRLELVDPDLRRDPAVRSWIESCAREG